MTLELNKIYQGDVLQVLRTWTDEFVQTVVTSPPYWGLRDYGVPGQIGLEKTPEEYVAKMTEVFKEVRRVLKKDGTAWVNMGDSSAGAHPGRKSQVVIGDGVFSRRQNRHKSGVIDPRSITCHINGLKPKDLCGIPWRLAFALQADGWYLRSDIIWAKPNPMPESVTDRPTKAHEYLFLLAKSERYFYDQEAIKEPAIYFDDDRKGRAHEDHKSMPTMERNGIRPQKVPTGWDTGPGSHDKKLGHYSTDKQRGHGRRHAGFNDRWNEDQRDGGDVHDNSYAMRNKRSVWTVATSPFPEAHFATFPEDLIKPCILAGSPPRGVVLDPFMGAGTTALVALKYDRQFLGIELKQQYVEMAEKRIAHERAQLKLAL